MALDLERIADGHPRPEGLTVELDEDLSVRDIPNLPYSYRSDDDLMIASDEFNGRRWHYVGYLDGKPVGHASVFVTFGPLGVGGIYSVGVLPECQKRGVGKAVTAAACLKAKELGCRYVLLNGTGQRMYEQIGFEHFGWGQTWWLNVPRLAKNPPTPLQIELAEAVGRGDMAALRAIEGRVGTAELNTPMTNEMSLLDLAVDQQKPESAEWLIANGAEPDLLAYRAFGWKERAEKLLSENPGLVNRRIGEWDVTPMHVAVENNDLDFARLLLRFGPDLDLKDKAYKSTPIGWAEHFGRTEILELLQGAGIGR
jgi:GNAT superfamily N-acetyltransferase